MADNIASPDAKPQDSPEGWVDRAPKNARPYLRLARFDRPAGAWLLAWPCLWGLALAGLATGTGIDWRLAGLFVAGAFLMRGAGSAYNDIIDRDFDAEVERTQGRPIPSGQISVPTALGFAILLSVLGLLVLLAFNRFTILLGLASLALVALYPFAKRFTDWPQLILGLAFNWGALLGWSAVTGGLGIAPLLLYAAGVAWTLGYDTIYAVQDQRDDERIGVRSTARRFGADTLLWLRRFYGAMLLLLLLGVLAAGGGLIAVGLVLAAGVHPYWQLRSFVPGDRERALRLFKANHGFGALLFLALAIA